jgi:hypothetical protein
MISIPVAVYNEWFHWQLDLFWHAHKTIYDYKAYKKAHAIIIKRNMENEEICQSYQWDIDIPYSLCESYFDTWKEKQNKELVPINIQIGLNQILHKFKDDEIIELLDCDMLHFSNHPQVNMQHDIMLVSTAYEDWHLFSKSTSKYIIEKYFRNDGQYYNGGFVPIIATTKTFKKIIHDWTWIHKDIANTLDPTQFKSQIWWAGMYALQAACERNHVHMISQDYCYLPNHNSISNQHYIGHYSIDKLFNKNSYPSINYDQFPNNPYYNLIKNWKNKSIANDKSMKFII